MARVLKIQNCIEGQEGFIDTTSEDDPDHVSFIKVTDSGYIVYNHRTLEQQALSYDTTIYLSLHAFYLHKYLEYLTLQMTQHKCTEINGRQIDAGIHKYRRRDEQYPN